MKWWVRSKWRWSTRGRERNSHLLWCMVIGRDWLAHLKLDWSTIFQVNSERGLQAILSQHANVFLPELGMVKGVTAKIHVDPQACPQFCKQRSVPFAMKQRLKEAGMRLKKEKCHFLQPSVEYLGHRISKEGLQPTEERCKAITGAPWPHNVSELKAFLGLINYYGKSPT